MVSVQFQSLPPSAAWTHHEARTGFEVVFFEPVDDGHLLAGCTTAVEEGRSWVVDYAIEVHADWRTRSARVTGRSGTATRTRLLESVEHGRWRVDGHPAPHLDGCLDVDLESSALTNALPVRRLGLLAGTSAQAPAASVRALDLRVERLEQHYARTDEQTRRQHYEYRAPAFDFSCQLVYDEAGLLLAYPGIAVRAA